MNSFLEILADEMLVRHGNDLASTAVVFPTRRAGLFFRRALSQKIDKPVWMPAIFSIQDFISAHVTSLIPDSLTLQVELYKVYKKYFPQQYFGSFLPWADVLLKDFDEADRYLVHAPSFFRNITELKQVEESFGLDEADEAQVREFWKSFYDREPGALKKNFYDSWQHLGEIYRDFRQALSQKGWAYEGQAYRELSESLAKNQMQVPYSNVLFAGLYALSRSEESIIESLVKQKKAELYWDTDAYYTNDARQEAGKFIRKNKLIDAEKYKWKFNYFETEEKNITSIGVPLQVGQARSAGQIIDDLIRIKKINPQRIAILLADEKMLFPVLYSLPESVDAVNVTMGFPLKDTPLFNLLESLMLLQKNYKGESESGDSWYHKQVAEILSHPYVRLAEPDFCSVWFGRYRENKWMRIPVASMTNEQSPALIRLIFQFVAPGNMCDYLRDIIEELLLHVRRLKGYAQVLETEFLFLFFTQVNRLKDLMPQISENITHETFWYLLRQIISQVKIPFTGEPLQGLQIMGLLESRLLDFDHLVFLSVNEDILPASSQRVSYVPYGIRKSFGLPSHEENHAVSSYHFFRLLQRASGIYLLHNSEPGALSSGERSRFVTQVQLELSKKYPGKIHFEEQLLLPEIVSTAAKPIVIEKKEDVLKSMEKFLSSGSPQSQYTRRISPSALSTYIQCGLKFYFSYVAGLKETEEVEDEIDARVFGEILHCALQNLYSEGITYTVPVLETLLEKAGPAVDNAIREKYKTETHRLEGKNIILRNVLSHLVAETIRQDSLQAPFRIVHLEKNYIFKFNLSSGKAVNVGGVVDRIDSFEAFTRILDYKTGKVEMVKAATAEELFTNPKHKERLQTFFYAWIYNQVTGQENIRSGIYEARKLSGGVTYGNDGQDFTAGQMKEFEINLRRLLDEIYDPAIPFVQTDDEKRCKYCAFKEICTR